MGAKPTATLATLLFLALAVLSSAQPPQLKELFDACEYVTVPQLCTSLAIKSGATSLRDLTAASVTQAINMAQEAKASAERVKASVTDEKEKGNLDACMTSYVQATETLKKVSNDLQAGVDLTSEITELRAALTYVGHCDDVFGENPGNVLPLADVDGILQKLVSNSHALTVSLNLKQNNSH